MSENLNPCPFCEGDPKTATQKQLAALDAVLSEYGIDDATRALPSDILVALNLKLEQDDESTQ